MVRVKPMLLAPAMPVLLDGTSSSWQGALALAWRFPENWICAAELAHSGVLGH